ncbi:helix-turn-helix domain-containing protein [Jiangella asiatica]|uniref:helix-turn-helix domain-containing protein n=1 Tax=Jiangella asiatica TaxID=2530372 RepID=UPI0013A5CE93|nr:AraC family transcriptional regulator [Jiangella asiatica]
MVGQTHREWLPSPRLAGLVSATWVQRVLPGAGPYPHRDIPDGSVHVVCRAGTTPRVAGPLTGPRVEVLDAGSAVVGLRFRQGAAADLLGLPVAELADVVVDATELWGSTALVAGERVAAATTESGAVAALEDLVAAAIGGVGADAPDPLIAEAVRRLMPWNGTEVGAVGAELGLSERGFRRRCRAAVGVGPKTLQRMLRFQGFLARVQLALSRGGSPDRDGLAGLAVDTGYADQAHLTRECVRLTGVTPRAFLRDIEETCGRGHDHAVSFTPLLRPG